MIEDGDPLPPNMPEMPPHLLWIVEAWGRLRDDRPWIPVGMGAPRPGRIPWTVLRLWARDHGLGEADFEMLDAGIKAMDEAMIADFSRRATAAAEAGQRPLGR